MSSNQRRQWRVGRPGIGRAREAGRHRLRPAVLILEDRRLMATFTVTGTSDTMTDGRPDPGTLRWAVERAEAATGPDTIAFQLGTEPATITLRNGQLELSGTGGPIAIVGPGASDLTVDAGGTGRVMQIDPGATASISGLTLSGGSVEGYGGGVSNQGTVALRDVVLTGNTSYSGGGGMANERTATLIDCTISGNISFAFDAGGVRNTGTLTMVDSTVSGNTGFWGLTNLDYGTATLDDSLVSANSYGGILNQSPVAGALTLTGTTVSDHPGEGVVVHLGNPNFIPGRATATLTDCTISGNAAVGVTNVGGSLRMDGCRVVGNGDGTNGGVLSWYGEASLADCTISDNRGSGIVNFSDLELTRCRITGNAGAWAGGGVLTNVYPHHSVTLTDCVISQNTASQYGGGVSSSGPISMSGCIVTGNVSEHEGGGGWFGPGPATLSGCWFAGNTAVSDGGGITAVAADLTISDSLLIGNTAGGKGGGMAIQGVHSWFGGPASVTIRGATIGGNSAAEGGGVYNGGTLDAEGLALLVNAADAGGGLYNAAEATANVVDARFIGNSASGDGGGAFNAGALTLLGAKIHANSAGGRGGGLYDAGTATLIDCTISGNTAAFGGGLYVTAGGTVKLARTKVKGNRGGDIVGPGSVT